MPVKWLFMSFLFYSLALVAAEEEAPSLDLLEFLGSFTPEKGDWIDPMQLEEMATMDTVTPMDSVKNGEKTHE